MATKEHKERKARRTVALQTSGFFTGLLHWRSWMLVLAPIFFLPSAARAQERMPVPEPTLKAQAIWLIIQNTIFPPEVAPKNGAPWKVLVWGQFPSRSDLIAAIRGLPELEGRRIEVTAVSGIPSPNDVANCHVIYIDGKIGNTYVIPTLQNLQDRCLLVVSDKQIDPDVGGMVRLKVEKTIAIEIWKQSAGRRKLEFRPPLHAYLK
jgi:hypothetical protein